MPHRLTIMHILGVINRIAFLMVVLIISPLVLLWLLIDFRRLKRVALEIEPMDPEYPMVYRNMWESWLFWGLRTLVAPVIIFIGLPLIALYGFFLWALFGDEDEEDQGLW